MALPEGIPTVTLTGTYLAPDGRPVSATAAGKEIPSYVEFRPPAPVTFPDHDVILSGPVTAKLDGNGGFTVVLPATDTPGMSPSGWAYTVTERLGGVERNRAPYQILLPSGTPAVDLADIAPTDAATPNYVAVKGDSAYDIAVANGFVGTEQEWLDSLNGATQAVITAAAFTATSPFRVAHRGSGGEFPEHTVAAYEAAVAAGAQAIEVSVHTTADGVPVCFHDVTLDRMTDFTGPIAAWTYAGLRERVKVKAWELLGSGWSDQSIPTLREVLDQFLGRVVIFLEAKSSASVVPVQNTLVTFYPGANQSVVWKNYYLSNSFPWAQANGFTTWGYVDAGTSDAEMDAVDANVDMWGVPHTMTDARIADVVARGKPVMCWEVHRRADVTRLTGLGVQGLMSSQFLYLGRSTPIATTDTFDSQVKAPGDIGVSPYDPVYALKYDNDGSGGAYINVVPNQGVLLGSLSPTPADGYTIRYEMMFEGLPPATQHAGIAFAKPDDSKYQFAAANSSGGYHIVFRGNGDMQLYTHTAGSTTGTQLGTIATAAPTAGQWMSFEIDVTATQVTVRRTDVDPDVTLTVDNAAYRGGYLHLSTGSVDSLANKPHWRNIEIITV